MTGKKKRAAWAAALMLLAAALVYFNLPTPLPAQAPSAAAEPGESFQSDAPLGHRPGEQLPDFTLTQTDGNPFTLSQYRGRVVVLNLWATWCTPCVNELPHFDRLQQAYPEKVKVLAIHSDLVTDDPIAYLSGFDYQIAFAVDPTGEVIGALGGSTMLPQTVVVSPYGEVLYNQVGSVTYEALEDLVLDAMVEQGKASRD